ncbi:hypothetical protein SCA6_016663 [Theobroma cacao]
MLRGDSCVLFSIALLMSIPLEALSKHQCIDIVEFSPPHLQSKVDETEIIELLNLLCKSERCLHVGNMLRL